MSQIIDLNELVPQPVQVRLGEKEYTIQPPSTAEMFELAELGQTLKKADQSSETELKNMFEALESTVYKIVPELKDVKLLPAQLFKLFEIIAKMATPQATGEPTETLKEEEQQ